MLEELIRKQARAQTLMLDVLKGLDRTSGGDEYEGDPDLDKADLLISEVLEAVGE